MQMHMHMQAHVHALTSLHGCRQSDSDTSELVQWLFHAVLARYRALLEEVGARGHVYVRVCVCMSMFLCSATFVSVPRCMLLLLTTKVILELSISFPSSHDRMCWCVCGRV